MQVITLSTGVSLDFASIKRAEFYPAHSLDDYGCHFGGAEMRACPYLFIETVDSVERVDGADADSDATALEQAGIHVVRHPLAETLPRVRLHRSMRIRPTSGH